MTVAESQTPALQSSLRALVKPWSLTALASSLALVAAVCLLGGAFAPFHPLVFLLVFVAFLITESVSLDVEFRRQTWSWSLSELALAFALVQIGGAWLALARGLALAAALSWQRFSPAKVVFNVAASVVEVAVAVAVLEALPWNDITEPRAWLWVLIAVLIASSFYVRFDALYELAEQYIFLFDRFGMIERGEM